MNVLIISAAFAPMRSGEADHALHLCQQLAASGLKIQMVTSKGASASVNPAVVVHPIMSRWSWRELPRLASLTKSSAPDAVLLLYSGWLYKDHPMITFIPTITKKLLGKVPFVTQFNTDQGADIDNGTLSARLIRKCIKPLVGAEDLDWEFGTLLRDSDNLIVLCEQYREKVTKLLPRVAAKALLLPPPPTLHLSAEANGETRARGRNQLRINSQEFLLVFFGYVYPNKGIDVLLRAFQRVARLQHDVRLAIIGGTEDDNTQREGAYAKEMRALAEELGISGSVIWSGKYQADSDYASVCLRAADACVLPFDNGITLNRSSVAAVVAHGLPTISTRGKKIEIQFVDRKNVLLCEPRNPDALAGAINELIATPALRNDLSKGALELAAE
jgi:glycosyltransferase involved in cell wall biosynthesis